MFAQILYGLSRDGMLGREFFFDVLQAMSDPSAGAGDEDALIDALETAERAQLIAEVKEKREPTYTFVHALIPSTLREGLSAVRRQRLRGGNGLNETIAPVSI